jgi:hypothetical protein
MGRATRFQSSLKKSRLEGQPIIRLVLHDPSISPHHARTIEIRQQFYVEDLGSQYGTWVNDALVGEYRLAPWDTIRVGIYTLVFNLKMYQLCARYRDVRRRGCWPPSIGSVARLLDVLDIQVYDHSILNPLHSFTGLADLSKLLAPSADGLIDQPSPGKPTVAAAHRSSALVAPFVF